MAEKIGIRAAGVVIDNNKLLLVRSKYPNNDKEFYLLPGGGLEDGESIKQAAEREILEETGYKVKAENEIYHVNEFVKGEDWKGRSICFFFKTRIEDENPEKPSTDDEGQIKEVEWISIDELDKYDVRPQSIVEQIKSKDLASGLYCLDKK